MVELQGHNGRTAACGTPDNACPVFTPHKVPRPTLTTGVKEPGASTRQWVRRIHLYCLETIAHSAGEPEIFFFVSTTSCLWYDVVDLQWSKDIALRTLAISTAVLRLYPHTCTGGCPCLA